MSNLCDLHKAVAADRELSVTHASLTLPKRCRTSPPDWP